MEEVYYIGFNANNAICNENFFKGSITLYPTKESGNYYYSNKYIPETNSIAFLKEYQKFVYDTVKTIQLSNQNANFICFNEKAIKLCSQIEGINLIKNNNSQIIRFLNNKFSTRTFIKDKIPTLDYYFFDYNKLNYEEIANTVGDSAFVLQGATGAGGDTTYFINNEKELLNINDKCKKYCVSSYIENIPLNITIVIGNYGITYLPISVQLIKIIQNKFKYVGGDFNYAARISQENIAEIMHYTNIIGNRIKKLGYRGIIGIDYILTKENEIIFMEINPRFQSSSFLISRNLTKSNNTCIAELHYNAITGRALPIIKEIKMTESFVNCNKQQEFSNINDYEVITNGYFEENPASYYRKVLKRSILHEDSFEKIK